MTGESANVVSARGTDINDITSQKLFMILKNFDNWLTSFGNESQDQYDFWATGAGQRSKLLYYKKPLAGKILASPFVILDSFFPFTRKYFMHRQRFPMAFANNSMAYSFMFKATGEENYYRKAVDQANCLLKEKCLGYKGLGWGYPFDWMTNSGTISKYTPLITNTPYGYEALRDLYFIDNNDEWLEKAKKVADHVAHDYAVRKVNDNSSASSYVPENKIVGGIRLVVNASSYRAFTLLDAANVFNNDEYKEKGISNLNFVLESQREDGSWYYAADGTDPFIDHFHTCFVLKNLIKISEVLSYPNLDEAIDKGMAFYMSNLFDENLLPKPFAKAQRITIYKQELYDYGECINLLLIYKRGGERAEKILNAVLNDLISRWITVKGHFRTRKLLMGWNNVPYLRWGQAQVFRSLALWYYLLNKNDNKE